jgi:hypothetical protein
VSQQTAKRWHAMRTDETRHVEAVLRGEFPRADAYRFNSASIRVRVIDPRFEGMSTEERDALVEPLLDQLPRETQGDIINLLTLAPTEEEDFSRGFLINAEFEDPSPSNL